jgi:MFS-type transporter involved in bile tolerance (Atg22 family)
MILVIFVGSKADKMNWKHYLFIIFTVIAQVVVTLLIVFTKQRPPSL